MIVMKEQSISYAKQHFQIRKEFNGDTDNDDVT